MGQSEERTIPLKDITVKLNINRKTYEVVAKPYSTLLYILREELGLTGTKLCCGTGDCGACTVIIDGKAVRSCLLLAAQAEGKRIVTIEGISQGNEPHPLQKAFVKYGAIQCGFCTPGMIMSAKALLDENANPTEEDVREAVGGNLCRCTGYVKPVKAIMAVIRARRKEKGQHE
jgi:carbon-monoxide dehydrogenase small subunit